MARSYDIETDTLYIDDEEYSESVYKQSILPNVVVIGGPQGQIIGLEIHDLSKNLAVRLGEVPDYESDEFNLTLNTALSIIRQVVNKGYGEKCADFDEGCRRCRIHKDLDSLLENLDLASIEDTEPEEDK